MSQSSSISQKPTLHVQLLAVFLTCGILQATAWTFPQVKLWPFACGSAHLAAGFLGCPVEALDGQWRLLTQPIGNIVHEGCSGYTYFTLLCMLGAFLAWGKPERGRHRKIIMVFLGLPIVTGIAILVNTARILCAFHVRVHTMHFIPGNLQPAAHLVTGTSMTICTLTAFIWIWKKHVDSNERKQS